MDNFPASMSTLIDLLRFRAVHEADQLAYLFLPDGETREIGLTYAELDQRARAVAVALQRRGAAGERVLLLYPPGLEYISAFFGCLYAGAIAVPAYPPDLGRQRPSLVRIRTIARDAQSSLALTTSAILSKIEPVLRQDQDFQAVNLLATDTLPDESALAWQLFEGTGNTLALLQYTSGSTAAPKGVMVTHSNLLYNHQMIQEALQHPARAPYVSWLPLYHDMGLIGNVLQALYVDAPCVLMPPTAFLQKPVRWLQAISHYKAHTSGGPNFAYDLCTRRISPEQRETLDLRSWKNAFNGSEPIRQEPLQDFITIFAPCNFKPEAFYPVYGLAEATAFVSGGLKSTPPAICSVKATAPEFHHVMKSHTELEKSGVYVSCGHAWLDEKILIVHPESHIPCLPEQVGEIWIAGPHVAQGYWNNQEATQQTFCAYLRTGEGPFLRTGDLGFVKDGELFVTGRIKDLIIIRGLNYYPQDIEKTVERCHPQLCVLACVAFSVPVQNEEGLVVVQEVERHTSKADLEEAIAEIRSQVSSVYGLSAYAIVLIKSNSIPKTTSGKLQHAEARKRFLEGTLDIVCQSISDGVKPDEGSRKQQSLIGQMMRSTPEGGRQQFIEIYLQAQIARITGIQPATIDWRQPIGALGLDSLMSVELKHQVETDLEVLLPLEELFQDWTLSQLSEAIVRLFNEGPRSGPESAIALLPSQELHGTHPLSSMQQGLWFLNQLRPASNEYNLSFRIQISGFLNVSRLEQSLNEIIQRHAILRATIVEQDGTSEMLIKPYQVFHLPVEECPFVGGDSCEKAISQRALAEARKPFNLASGPLFRFLLLRISNDEHALLLNVHHIIFDGWSLGVLLRELTALYASHANGNASALPPLITHYGEYVSWQQKWLRSKAYAEQLSYWQRQLADVPAVLDLPTDYPRPPLRSFQGARHSFEISLELLERLKQFSRREQTTLFTILLATFQILLFRYSGQKDIVVGTPVSGRGQAAIKDLIGFFVNTLAIRTDFSTVSDFSALLNQVKATLVAAYAHADVPFEAIVEVIQPERDLSHTPVFQVMFAMQNIPMPALQTSTITLSPAEIANGNIQCDLSLSLLETPTRLLGHVDYTTDLFELPTIQRFTQHFQILLQGIVGCPQERISDLPLLTQHEREQLLIQWNATRVAYPQNQCLHQLFEAQAQRTPEAVALIFEQQQLSYGELNARANQLAHYLQRVGVGPEVLVGICLERSLELVVALLAVLKAGGAYVPLDPTYPQERLAFMLEDAQISLLLTFQNMREKWTAGTPTLVCLDGDWHMVAKERDTTPTSLVQVDNLAYVIYTSGSTGRPKGVQVTHKGIGNLALAQAHIFAVQRSDRVLQPASLSFDASLAEIAVALLNGATLVLVTDEKCAGMGLHQHLDEQAISVVTLTPTVLSTLPVEALSTLQTVIVAGEMCPPDLLERWAAGRRFFNAYGPTETTVCASIAPYQESQLKPHIGRSISNVRIYVLDQNLQPVPIGVVGELYIGGVGLARGYGQRPELTAERFVPDPFSEEGGGRLYRTGDLARYLPDGNLEFMGRVDQQVKIRGFRIELGEIEAVLHQHPAITACVVLVQEKKPGDRQLIAYLVPRFQTMPSITDLRRTLQEQLPEYMIPSLFEILPALPLTPNGKVDRRALRASTAGKIQVEDASPAPRTATEEVLAAIWSHVLQVEWVGIHDNFFTLGGHSLLATQIIFRINQAFHREISIRQLFEAPTVADLAHCLEKAQRETSQRAIPPLEVAPARGQALPLSFAQQRLWFLDQLTPGNPFYNVPFVIRLQGPLAVAALELSFQKIVQRHEILRTTFVLQEDQPVQLISPGLSVALPLLDLSELPQTERERLVQILAQQESARSFDLATGPLLRLHLLRLGLEEHILLLDMHHIISDAWSMSVFLQELVSLYGSLVTGQAPSLPELPIQYADYAYWQRQWLQGETLSTQLAYWQEQLAGAPAVLDLITDHPRPAVQTYRGDVYEFILPTSLTQDLKEVSREQEATLFMTLLAAFGCLLARYSHQQDIIIGTPIANRARMETEPLIGFFMNTLALRLNLHPLASFTTLLDEVRELTLNAYAHQDLPFEQLVETLRPERNLSHAPLFQVLFTLQNTPMPPLQMHELQVDIQAGAWHSAKFDLSLLMNESEGRLKGIFEYSTDLFETGTIERLAGHLQTLLEGIVANRQQRLSHLPLLVEQEHRLLLKEWNTTQEEYPTDGCVHQLFEKQVEYAPEALAIIYGEEQISYSELNSRANQLAHYLRSLGVGPDECVGLCLDRTPDLVVAVLGILKAGGAYVPLDQTYPAERLALMLADTRIKVVVTYRRFASSFPGQPADLRLLCLDEAHEIISAQGWGNPHIAVSSSNLCYVVYTSGSTGVPKGVYMPHRPLTNLVYWQLKRSPSPLPTRTIQFSSLLFDPLFQELFCTFAAGGALVLIPEAIKRDPEYLLAVMDAEQIECIYLPFVALHQLAGFAQATGKTLACLREILTAGEQLQMTPDLRAWLKNMPQCRLYNYYGPSETHVVTSFQLPSDPHGWVALPPIGTPIANTQLYVLDAALFPVPVGVAGELYIGGDSVGRGYANQPHMTAERFLPDPFSDRPGSFLYKTGDRVRYLPDGNLEFLGRLDSQVKIRGYRVELGEIEFLLQQHPQVKECAVVMKGEGSEKRLLAYIVAYEKDTKLRTALPAYLKTKLPEYMLPVAYMLIDSLPVTATGKVNRKALLEVAPEKIEIDRHEAFVAPRTPLEQELSDIWSELLQVTAIGIHDDFFEMGGHSLLATRLMVCIRDRIQPDFALQTIFEAPTIAALAEIIVRQEIENADSELLLQLLDQLEDTRI